MLSSWIGCLVLLPSINIWVSLGQISFMGCLWSNEKNRSFSLEDGHDRRTLAAAYDRHELLTSGLEGKKFLPLIPGSKKIACRRRGGISRADQVPLAAVVSRLNDVKGHKLNMNSKTPARISNQVIISSGSFTDDTDNKMSNNRNIRSDTSEEFSFLNTRLHTQQMVPEPNHERCLKEDLMGRAAMKPLRVASAETKLVLGQEQSIYSPTSYVTPRFGTYALSLSTP